MGSQRHIVIVGATSAIAHACARLWAEQGPTYFSLLGRNEQKLEAVAADLRLRGPETQASLMLADFLSPEAINAVVAQVVETLPADLVLIAHGALPEQSQCQDDLNAANEALLVNGLSPVLFAEAFAKRMSLPGVGGTIVVIGSVAGDRGRRSNYVYGAAKAMAMRYVEGMQHRFAGSDLRIVLIKPGPTATPMTAHLRDSGMPMAELETVARGIVDVASRCHTAYVPFKWRIVMGVLRVLPAWIFNRLPL